MKTGIAVNVLIALQIIIFGSPFFAVAEEKGAVVIYEQKLKVMLEEFVDENAADPEIQRYGFDMTKSFMEMDLREETIEGHRIWSLGPWTVEINQYGGYEVHQSTYYGPNLALLTVLCIVHGDRCDIVDIEILELELEE